MPARKHILFLLGLVAVIALFAEALMMRPEDRWQEVMQRESRMVEGNEVVQGTDRSAATLRRSAQQQWNLAEHYYMQGELDKARYEYERIKNEFPYVELDYGFRTDDATKRIAEIDALKSGGSQADKINPNIPLSGD